MRGCLGKPHPEIFVPRPERASEAPSSCIIFPKGAALPFPFPYTLVGGGNLWLSRFIRHFPPERGAVRPRELRGGWGGANARGAALGPVVPMCLKQTPSPAGPRMGCTSPGAGVPSACHSPSCSCLSTPHRQRKTGCLAGPELNFMEVMTKQASTTSWEEPNP